MQTFISMEPIGKLCTSLLEQAKNSLPTLVKREFVLLFESVTLKAVHID